MSAPTRDAVVAFVVAYLESKERLPTGIDLERFDFIEAGFVDSIGLIRFVAKIESAFGMDFADGDVFDADFRTVGGLADLVLRRWAGR